MADPSEILCTKEPFKIIGGNQIAETKQVYGSHES
jgi:hypothetical protein